MQATAVPQITPARQSYAQRLGLTSFPRGNYRSSHASEFPFRDCIENPMIKEDQEGAASYPRREAVDASSDVRVFASWFGLVLVAMGVAMAGYLFFRIGQVLLDPRAFETNVDRWEFVMRGRVNDALPAALETPERRLARPLPPAGDQDADPATETPADYYEDPPPATAPVDPVEDMARLAGRIASKSARPMALLLLIMVLTLLVRIIVAVIHAGIRLAGLAGGEREYMKRIIDELMEQRRR